MRERERELETSDDTRVFPFFFLLSFLLLPATATASALLLSPFTFISFFCARAGPRRAHLLFCSAHFYFLLFFCLFFCFHRNRGALRGAPLLRSLSIPAPTRKSMMSISLLSPPHSPLALGNRECKKNILKKWKKIRRPTTFFFLQKKKKGSVASQQTARFFYLLLSLPLFLYPCFGCFGFFSRRTEESGEAKRKKGAEEGGGGARQRQLSHLPPTLKPLPLFRACRAGPAPRASAGPP